jgi:ATP-binding cassette subfamily F protein uup
VAASVPARERRGDPRAAPREARRELTRLERLVATLDKREAALHLALAQSATDYARVAELDAELREVVAARETAELEWLTLAEDA